MFNNHTYATYKGDVKSAEQWRDHIKGGRNKISRTIGNNTTVRDAGDGFGVIIKLHDTDIVKIADNGAVQLDTGGWLSVTTKERLNRYTNAGISQRQGVWYMADGSLFYDGIIIEADGTVKNPKTPTDYESKLKAIKRDAKAYAADYVDALKAGLVGAPTGGDCWACLMKGPKGQEAFVGSGHIRDHIDEKYFVPSLLVNAARAAHYTDMQISLMGFNNPVGRRVFIEPQTIIYKYVVNELRKELA